MAHRFSWWSTSLLGLLLGVSGAEQSCELPTFPLVELNDDKFGVTQRKAAALPNRPRGVTARVVAARDRIRVARRDAQ